MKGMAKGRPRKSGKRQPNGQLRRVVANDQGNDRVQARREAFKVFQGGKADQQISDAIGRAWAAGLLDGQAFDAEVLRDAGREYGALYWEYYQGGPATANMDGGRGGRDTSTDIRPDPKGRHFDRLDNLAFAAGHVAYQAMHQLVVNEYWFPDDNPAWLERLLNSKLVMKKQPVAGQIAFDSDVRILENAVAGLLAMVGGK